MPRDAQAPQTGSQGLSGGWRTCRARVFPLRALCGGLLSSNAETPDDLVVYGAAELTQLVRRSPEALRRFHTDKKILGVRVHRIERFR